MAGGSNPDIINNNIFGNSGFAVNNIDPGVLVKADRNYWGNEDPATVIQGNVQAERGLEEPLTFIAGIPYERLAVSAGTKDSISFEIRSYSGSISGLQVSMEDELGWVTKSTVTVDVEEGTGASAYAVFEVPEGTAEETRNLLWFSANANGVYMFDEAELIVYEPVLSRVEIYPWYSVIAVIGESLQFSAAGRDQYALPVPAFEIWSAESGSIDSTGLFIPDSVVADVVVTATDTATGLSAEVTVMVRNAAPELATITVAPDSASIAPGDSVQFSAATYDQYDRPYYARITWEADGGSIDESGLFIADSTEGMFTVSAKNDDGTIVGEAYVTITGDPLSVESPAAVVTEYTLYQNYPNPFNPSTTISYAVPEDSRVSIHIYNMLGELVRQFDEGIKPMGRYSLQFNAADLASGIYFYQIKAGRFHEVKKMLLVK